MLAVASLILSIACKLVRLEPPDFFPGMVICFIMWFAWFTVTLGFGAVMVGMDSIMRMKTVGDLQEVMRQGGSLACS